MRVRRAGNDRAVFDGPDEDVFEVVRGGGEVETVCGESDGRDALRELRQRELKSGVREDSRRCGRPLRKRYRSFARSRVRRS